MLHALWNLIKSDDSGQDLAEYALLLVLIAVAVVAVFPAVAAAIVDAFNQIIGSLAGAGGGGA